MYRNYYFACSKGDVIWALTVLHWNCLSSLSDSFFSGKKTMSGSDYFSL